MLANASKCKQTVANSSKVYLILILILILKKPYSQKNNRHEKLLAQLESLQGEGR